MTDENKYLPSDPEALQKMVLSLQSQFKNLTAEKLHLIEQFRLTQQQRFRSSNESHPAQGDLFNEAEVELDVTEETVESTPTTTKKKPVSQKLPKDLEREVIIHDLSEEEKTCDCCGHHLHQMGESRSEKLEFIPASVKVIEHVRLKYSCRTCEKENVSTKVKSAPVPSSPIPKGIATPSLLSQIITSKYQYALPLYRQESLFKQYGIALSRKTMINTPCFIHPSVASKPHHFILKVSLTKHPVLCCCQRN